MATKTVTYRYPYTGESYTAEGKHRIRVDHDGKWGYFNDYGHWLEGEVRFAEPCMCRFMSSAWVFAQTPEQYGIPRPKKARTPLKKSAPARSK